MGILLLSVDLIGVLHQLVEIYQCLSLSTKMNLTLWLLLVMMVNVGICIPGKLGDTETKFKRKAAALNLQILDRNERRVYASCLNTDNGAEDSDGDGCEEYEDPDDCGAYDDDDFEANKVCCTCGGGATKVDGKLKETCVYKTIEESECPSSSGLYQADYLECNEEGLKHGDFCWVADEDYPLIDGSIGEDEGMDCCSDAFCDEYVFKCVKECSKDQDCSTRYPYCIDGSCEECLGDQDCPTTRPFCLESRCKGPYPITAPGSDCSDYGLQPLTDKSICQQLSDDLFPGDGDISDEWSGDYMPLGCSLYEGSSIDFNDGSEGSGRYYDRMAVCIAEPIDCEWSKYSKWSKCKNGKEERTRVVETRALFGGKCKGKEKQTRTCGEEGLMIVYKIIKPLYLCSKTSHIHHILYLFINYRTMLELTFEETMPGNQNEGSLWYCLLDETMLCYLWRRVRQYLAQQEMQKTHTPLPPIFKSPTQMPKSLWKMLISPAKITIDD